MDGLEEKLSALFASPESVAQLRSLAESLGGALGGGGDTPEQGAAAGAGEGPDPRLMQLLGGVLREYNAPSRTAALVSALTPWLREDSAERLNKALRIARLTRAAKTVLPELGFRRP